MKFAGEELLSRSTIASGRSLLGLGAASILIDRIGIDTAGFEVLGLAPSPVQLTIATLWALGALWMSLLVNWLSDLPGLGRWNQAMYSNRVETVNDGGGKIRSRLEFLVESMEYVLNKPDGEKITIRDGYAKHWRKELTEMNRSFILFDRVARLYVIGWGFLIPSAIALIASILLFWETNSLAIP
jgi:hypothetical protein